MHLDHLKVGVKQCVWSIVSGHVNQDRVEHMAWVVDLPYMHLGFLTTQYICVSEIPSSGAIIKLCFLHLFNKTKQ